MLYLVGTPIGNLEDMTFRAVRILQTVHLIAAEDTRHTGKLLQHFEITTPQISYHEHNSAQRIPELISRLQAGETIALVTDAGMPGISDPGYELVRECAKVGISVTPIPGATAAITALSAAGLPTDRFVFEGFLPAKGKERRSRLTLLQPETRTIILYEAPHRLPRTLEELGTILGRDRALVLARELTKRYEEFWHGTIAEAITHLSQRQPKGEYTLVIAGTQEDSTLMLSESEIQAEMQGLIEQGMTRSQASRHLASLTSLSRRQIYSLAQKEESP